MPAATSHLPGIYPVIVKLKPKIGGKNNLGVGVDQDGGEYVLKRGPALCIAEFVGAALCKTLGVPHCQPNIVQHQPFGRPPELVFGSALEPGKHTFDQSNPDAWLAVTAVLENPHTFSTVLAADLAIGNDDRHADNWLIKNLPPGASAANFLLMGMDFSNAWPTTHPPHHPLKHPSINTWDLTRHWQTIGITFERSHFYRACARIGSLDAHWLHSVLQPLVGVWMTPVQQDAWCLWWASHWRDQVIDVIHSLESDGGWL